MKEELEKEIDLIKEVLSAMPQNNKKNKQKYREELEKKLFEVNNTLEKIIKIFYDSNSKYNSLIPNPEIEVLKKQKYVIENNLKLLNEYNSSFEKLGLDRFLYDISKYYEGNLIETNKRILSVVGIFKEVGIDLTVKDFNYCHYVEEYMEEFFKGGADFEEVFEQIYWKCPNIITYIGLNIRYLYLKNQKIFDKYILNKQQEILNNISIENIWKEYYKIQNRYKELINNDTCLNFDKFKQKELKTADYSKDKIEKLYSQFIKDNNPNLYDESLVILLNNLIEYQNYLKYQYIYNDVKKIYLEKDKYKNVVKTKLKSIKKEEKKLYSINRKYNLTKNDVKRTKLDLDINNCMKNLINLYNELENDVFNEKVLQLSSNDSIEKVFEVASSYYIFMIKSIKNNNQDISSEEINKILKDFNSFLLNNNLMISNLNLSEDYDFPMIISDKYKLMNIEISIESLDENNLDNLINQIETIIDYNIFNNLDISFKEVDEYCKIQDLLNSIK